MNDIVYDRKNETKKEWNLKKKLSELFVNGMQTSKWLPRIKLKKFL